MCSPSWCQWHGVIRGRFMPPRQPSTLPDRLLVLLLLRETLDKVSTAGGCCSPRRAEFLIKTAVISKCIIKWQNYRQVICAKIITARFDRTDQANLPLLNWPHLHRSELPQELIAICGRLALFTRYHSNVLEQNHNTQSLRRTLILHEIIGRLLRPENDFKKVDE